MALDELLGEAVSTHVGGFELEQPQISPTH